MPSGVPESMTLPQTDWLRHDLTVTGPAETMRRFETVAAGAGVIPWWEADLHREEEDRFLALINPPDGSAGLRPAAARALARQLRSAVETHHLRILAASAQSSTCPFDLHRLVPVPDRLLRLGRDHPASLAWLRQSWGVVEPLRRVARAKGPPDRRLRRSARLAFEFWSADWTPWAALITLRRSWPDLVFDIRPDYRHE
jgi:hypothetical protein